MRRVMQRVVAAAAMVAAIWIFAAQHVDATMSKAARHHPTCQQIRAALQAGKSVKEVEKELKVSSSHVRQCRHQKMTSAANPQRSSPQAR